MSNDWEDWRVVVPGDGDISVFNDYNASSIAFDRLAGANNKCEIVLGDRSGTTMVEVIKYTPTTTIIASREMPDTPEELLAWYTMVVRMHVD